MLILQLNEATAAQRRIPFYAVDITDGFTPETGLSSFVVDVSENGAGRASGAGSDPTEVDATNMPGYYYYEATAAELSTVGFLAISIKHANMRDFFAIVQVVAFDPYSATNLGLTNVAPASEYDTELDVVLSTRAPSNEYDTELDANISTRAPANEYDTQLDANMSTRSSHNAAAIWAEAVKVITGGVLTTPADYKATGFSTHTADNVWAVGARTITGGALTTPADYKATGFSTHGAADVWTAGSRSLSTPNDYKATGFSTHAAADIWSVGTRTLSGTIGDFDALDTALDSAHGAGSWLTGGAGGATIQTIPSIPKNIDLSDTKTVRIALYLNDQNDDLPTTGEITPGTIKIDRSADGGTSWSTIRNDVNCLEHIGAIYYDEVFSSGNGYASADMIRITFKGQIVTISANDHVITDPTDGMVFITRMDSGLSGGGPSAGDIADAVWEEPKADHTTDTTFGGKNQKVVPSETLVDYKATGFSTHAAADIWSVGTRVITGGALTTPADYKATGFSTHSAANVWEVGTKVITGGVLTTPADYKATGFSIHSAADIWTVGSRGLSTPADYKATGFSVPNEYDADFVTVKADLDNPNQYKADVSAIVITGGVLTTPGDYKATGFAVPNEYDAELTAIQADLDNPTQYMANVSALALETTVQAIKTLTDNLPADTELELIKLKGLGGIWLVAEYHHDVSNDNDYIQFWQYGTQADFDNETKANAVNKWRQDITYTANLPIKSKWDKVT